MRKILLLTIGLMLCLSASVEAAMTYGAAYYQKRVSYLGSGYSDTDPLYLFMNEVETTIDGTSGVTNIIFTPGTAPASTEGSVYYDSSGNWFKGYNGTSWVTFASAAGNSLDAAYDLGNKIDVDGDVLELEVDDGSNNVALLIDHDEATNDNDAMQITNAADAATAVSIQIDGTAGFDIQGTSDTWNVSIAGAASLVGITNTAADCLWDDTYDMSWDTSRDQLLFEDNAVLGIGGAHDAAADFTLTYDATDLLMEAAAADDVWKLGATTNFDVIIYGDTATDLVTFDTSAEDVQFNGFDLTMQDADIINFGDNDDITMAFDGAGGDLDILGSGLEIAFGVDDEGIDLVWHTETTGDSVTFDESGMDIDLVDVDVGLDDDALLQLGSSDDITLQFDGTNFEIFASAIDTPLALGGTTNGFDVTYYFEAAGQFRTDFDGDFINLTDDMDLRFGAGASSDGDFQISSNATNVLAIEQVAADTGTMTIGADGTDIPLTWYAESTSDFVLLTGDDLQLEDVSLCLADSTELQFGDALGTGDIKVYATGTDLIIDGVVAETGTVAIGVTDLGLDFKLWAATNAEGVLWDASDEALEFTGANVTLDAASVLTLGQTVNADVVVTDAATYTVLVANSGKVHMIADLTQNSDIDLPAEADGLYYRFLYIGGADDAHDHTIDSENNTNFFIGGVAFADTDAGAGADEINAGIYSDGNSNSKLTINNASAGTVVELHCDGTNWYVSGRIFSDTAPAFADQ